MHIDHLNSKLTCVLLLQGNRQWFETQNGENHFQFKCEVSTKLDQISLPKHLTFSTKR